MTRATLHLPLVLAVIASIAGCHAPAAKPDVHEDLRPLVGRQVHMEGRFDGPGKLADYIRVPSGQIYLFDPIFAAGARPEFGTTVLVDGLLGYRSYPPSTEPNGALPAARPPDHYYINHAKVRVLQSLGVKP